MWHFYAWKCILERKNIESLTIVRHMLKLSVLSSSQNRHLTIQLLEHQGILHLAMHNFKGALTSFEKMRNVAESVKSQVGVMQAHYKIAKAL